jgi:hypothetical protein
MSPMRTIQTIPPNLPESALVLDSLGFGDSVVSGLDWPTVVRPTIFGIFMGWKRTETTNGGGLRSVQMSAMSLSYLPA